jgi:hypothetical protein
VNAEDQGPQRHHAGSAGADARRACVTKRECGRMLVCRSYEPLHICDIDSDAHLLVASEYLVRFQESFLRSDCSVRVIHLQVAELLFGTHVIRRCDARREQQGCAHGSS